MTNTDTIPNFSKRWGQAWAMKQLLRCLMAWFFLLLFSRSRGMEFSLWSIWMFNVCETVNFFNLKFTPSINLFNIVSDVQIQSQTTKYWGRSVWHPSQQKPDFVYLHFPVWENWRSWKQELATLQVYMQNMKWVTADLVCPAQTVSAVITAGSSGESRSAQSSRFHYTHTHTESQTLLWSKCQLVRSLLETA